MKKVTVDAEEILVAYAGGKYYAIGGKCTHKGGDLSKGGRVVWECCEVSASRCEIRCDGGEVLGGPAKKSEPTYEVNVEGNNIRMSESRNYCMMRLRAHRGDSRAQIF